MVITKSMDVICDARYRGLKPDRKPIDEDGRACRRSTAIATAALATTANGLLLGFLDVPVEPPRRRRRLPL
jgi:hypothetical protein